MRITPAGINTIPVFTSKKQKKKEERLERKEALKPYARYQQKEAKLRAQHLGVMGVNFNKSGQIYPIVAKDRRGRLIYTQDKLSDGTIVIKYYDKDKMTSASKFYPDGKSSFLYIDENGKPISREEKNPDGSRYESLYDEDGRLFAIKTKDSNGTHLRKYNQDGMLCEETFLSNDGEYTNARYNRGEHGDETILETLSPDGTISSRYETRLIYNDLADRI